MNSVTSVSGLILKVVGRDDNGISAKTSMTNMNMKCDNLS